MIESIEQGYYWPLIKIIGIISVIVSSVISFIAYAIKDYLLNRWKGEQEKEITLLKSKADHNSALINNITSSISATFLASSEKRINAIETVWSCMVDIRQNVPHLVFTFYTLLSKRELKDIASLMNENLGRQINDFKPNNYYDYLTSLKDKVDKIRPFIGDELWKIFYVYSAFFGRLTYLVQRDLPTNMITHWTEDLPFQTQMLGYVIEDDTLRRLMSNEMNGLHDVTNYMEYKALNEISELIAGKRFTEEAVKQSLNLSTLIQSSMKD